VNRRAFRPCGCGDSRVWAGASGRLVRDERGMSSCLNGKRGPAGARWACSTSLPIPSAAARRRLRRKVPVPERGRFGVESRDSRQPCGCPPLRPAPRW